MPSGSFPVKPVHQACILSGVTAWHGPSLFCASDVSGFQVWHTLDRCFFPGMAHLELESSTTCSTGSALAGPEARKFIITSHCPRMRGGSPATRRHVSSLTNSVPSLCHSKLINSPILAYWPTYPPSISVIIPPTPGKPKLRRYSVSLRLRPKHLIKSTTHLPRA